MTNQIGDIPPAALAELALLPQWVVWQLEERDDGKYTKVPYNAYTGGKAMSNNPDTWASYPRAVQAQKHGHGRYAGIGFVFTQEITGVDLDDCIDNEGNIEVWAKDYLTRLQSYAEKSPSGTGIHIYIKARLKSSGKRRKVESPDHPKAAIEIYEAGRYFTWTGKHISGTPETINDAQGALDAILREIDPPKKQEQRQHNNPTTTTGPIFLGDSQIVNKATHAKNGSKFHNLWHGNTGGYVSTSEADLALCNLLAFWTGKDAIQMDRLFRQSGLYREKWDETHGASTYGERTITLSIEHCTEVYTGYESISTVSQNGHSNGHSNGGAKKPDVIIGRQLEDMVKDALAALSQYEEKRPTIFVQSARLVKVACDEEGKPTILPIGVAEIKNELTASANYYRARGEDFQPVSPPKDIAESILALTPDKWPFPPIKAIIEIPIIRSDGSILGVPGYDSVTHLYYHPAPGLSIPSIPLSPTQDEVRAAREFVHGFITDFPYVSEADKANAYGLLLTTVVRHLVRHTPCALANGTKAGTGKGLLTDGVALIATGRTASSIAQVASEEEWDKRITALLLTGTTFISIDNVEGTLRSAMLSKALTSDTHRGRVLGISKMADVPQQAIWMANGNNIQLGGDMPRRCYPINMAVQVSDPWTREDFTYPNLIAAIKEHRGKIIAALLTMARGWFAAGKPAPTRKLSKLATFSEWVDLVGGILSYAGVDGFLGNLTEMHQKADVDGRAWAYFLETWLNKLGPDTYTTKQLLGKLEEDAEFAETLPDPLATIFQDYTSKPMSVSRKFGKALSKKNGTPYGTDNVRIVQDEDSHAKVATYKVAGYAGFAGLNSSLRYGKKELSREQVERIEEGAELIPQTPHTPQDDETAKQPAIIRTEKPCYKCGSYYIVKQDDGPPMCVCQQKQKKEKYHENT